MTWAQLVVASGVFLLGCSLVAVALGAVAGSIREAAKIDAASRESATARFLRPKQELRH